MKFWDSSGIVPLILDEPSREDLLKILRKDSDIVVWWGTPVECASAVARRERGGDLNVSQSTDALKRLRSLSEAWHEVLPSEPVRTLAQRLLRVHSLRAADALQLAAASVAASGQPGTLQFLSLDIRLIAAAQREGFQVIETGNELDTDAQS